MTGRLLSVREVDGVMGEKIFERFWAKVYKSDGCWLWTGAQNSRGYGCFGPRLAHRVSWEIANGKPPDADKMVCHHCDNPRCVRPDHLFLGTAQDNSNDCMAKDRQARGSRNGRSVLDEPAVVAIRESYAAGADSQVGLALKHHICQQQIKDIVSGRSWKNAGGPISSPYRKAERAAGAARRPARRRCA